MRKLNVTLQLQMTDSMRRVAVPRKDVMVLEGNLATWNDAVQNKIQRVLVELIAQNLV